MNNHIKQLIKQATTTRYTGLGEIDDLNPEKLVELVVAECAELMYGRDENGNCKDGDTIKKHFGVV
jgi:hypothetical protein